MALSTLPFRLLAGLVPAAFVIAACTVPLKTTPAPAPPAEKPVVVKSGQTLTGKDALGDWAPDAPGVRRKLTVAALPAPYATRGVDNGPRLVRRPENAWPKAPAGFTVEQYITGLNNPREIVTAP